MIKKLVGIIDLELGNDPVESHLHGVCHIQDTVGGKYILTEFDNPNLPVCGVAVSKHELKILRCRYLVNRGKWSKEASFLPNGERQRIMRLYNLDEFTVNLLDRLKSLK